MDQKPADIELQAVEIRRLRKAAKVTQAFLAEKLGVSRSIVSQWECGRTKPSPAQLRAILDVLESRTQNTSERAVARGVDAPINSSRSRLANPAYSDVLSELKSSQLQPRIYHNESSAILHANATEALTALPSGIANLIFVDPPYNIGKRFANFRDKWPDDESYLEWCKDWLTQCIRVLAPNGTLYVMSSTQAMPFLDVWLRDRLEILSRIVWHYDSSGVQARKYFGSLYEPILHCVADRTNYTFNAEDILVEAKTGSKRKLIDYRKPVPRMYNSTKVPGNVWYFPRVRYRMDEYEEHPSQKPEILLERIIKASSNSGDLVLDPFAGTFTTGAVAARFGRMFVGIESQEAYVKIGLRRLNVKEFYNGERLEAPEKSYVRRNGIGAIRSGSSSQRDLFGAVDD